MKILALRGENLASLEHFDIPFDVPPLSESGLLSIDGPTGSGKSTLLDTLCLALFDRMPRLVGARDAAEAVREGLSPTDPRAVLRRGAGSGMAEVDFRGRDGDRYRASWEVWRARRSPDGRLQNQRVRLLRLDGAEELTGKHRTETLSTIQDRLGLDFDQFRRAVLLAQGDFSAFLRARPEERAQLLERMTGTEAFSWVSMAAFGRHKEDEARVAALETRRAGVAPLAPELRADLEQRRDAAAKAAAGVKAELEALQQKLQARRQRTELSAELQAAEHDASRAEAAWTEAAPLRARLALEERLSPLRAPWSALQESLQQAARLRSEVEGATEQARSAGAARTAAQSESQAAEEASRAHQARAAALAPELDAAAALDAKTRSAETELGAAATQVEGRRSELQRAVEGASELRRARAAIEADLRRVGAELDEESRRLAAVWPSLERELGRWVEALAERDRTLTELGQHAEAERDLRARLERQLEALSGHVQTAQARRKALEAARDRLNEHRRVGGPHRLSEAFGALSRLRSELTGLRRRMEQARQDRTAIGRLRKEADKARATLKKARAEARRATRSRRQKEAELQELEQRFALDHLRRQLYEHRSALLQAEGPCPLCGAETHGAPEAPAQAEAAELHRFEKLREQIQKLESRRVDKEIEDKTATERLAELERGMFEREERAESASAAWTEFRRSLETVWVDSAFLAYHRVQSLALQLQESPSAKQLNPVEQALAQTSERLEAHAAEDERRAAQLEQQETAEARARDARDQAESERRRQQDELTEHLAAGNLLRQKADGLVGAGFAERVRELCPSERVEAALADPAAFLAEWGPRMARAAALLEHEGQQQALQTQLTQRLSAAEGAVFRLYARFEEARARRDRAQAQRDEAAGARAELLGGEKTEKVKQALEAERVERARRSEAAGRAAAQAASDEAAAAARTSTLSEALQRSEGQVEAQRERVSQKAAEAGFELEALPELLGAPLQPDARAQVAALVEARQASATALDERRQRLERFDLRYPELPDAEILQAAEAETRRRLEVIEEGLLELKTRLAQDEAARREHAALQAELTEAETRRRLSAELSALIGSADGRKFRTFAQGLSLSALLGQANLQLRRLRPRYRLVRAPGRDIDIQVVDQDLGDEIRSVSTLSGGESFLVSLALALGLSSLSAQDLSIESLFIDEGFGQLDREALDVAISTLDALQAEGRSIAIVSHVPDVAERIGFGVEVRPMEPGRSRVRIRSG